MDTVHECDRRTDRRTDRITITKTVQRRASHGKKLDPENVGVAVGIFSLCALELEICLGVGNFTPHYSLPPLPANVAKNRCRDKGQHSDTPSQMAMLRARRSCYCHVMLLLVYRPIGL